MGNNAEVVEPGPSKAGLWEDFVDIFYAPSSVFARRADGKFGLALLFLIVAFPNARAAIADQTSVNRISLQFAPLMIVFAALAFRAMALRFAGTRVAGEMPGG